jgi:hypothetical protein
MIHPTNLIGVWTNDYFSSPDSNLWPPRTVFNGTNILFQGCNTVSIPLKFDSNTVTTLPNSAVAITRKACGNSDQQFIDIIGKSTRVEPVVNDTHLILTFYDAGNQRTFVTSRKLNANELSNIVLVDGSATQGSSQSTSTQTQSSANSNSNTQSTANSQSQSTSQTPTAPAQTTTTQTTIIPPTSAQTATPPSAQSSSLSTSEVQKALVGIYNPKMLYSRTLPPALASTIMFIFALDSVSVLGLCQTYKYPLTIASSNNAIEVAVNPANRLVRPNKANCDPAEDQLYLGAL